MFRRPQRDPTRRLSRETARQKRRTGRSGEESWGSVRYSAPRGLTAIVLNQPTFHVTGAVVPRRVEDPSGNETYEGECSDYHDRDDDLGNSGDRHARATMYTPARLRVVITDGTEWTAP